MIELDPATAHESAQELRRLAQLLEDAADRARRRGLAALAGALTHASAESAYAAGLEDTIPSYQQETLI